ncbi:putative porin [Paraburkholderia sp. GAS199]|uniref:porin n=1 Tax=Paraburkholderia sp. GAS199 TaxID=3035126 RepID=UPI003D1A270E
MPTTQRRTAVGHCASALALILVTHGVLAQAEDRVLLYGVLDTSIEVTNPSNGWTERMDSGAYRGSRVGLRGSESLGNHLDVIFDLENGFNSADGTLSTAGTLFNRQAWVGLQGDFGQVRVGRQYSPIYIPFKGQLDAFGAGTIASGLNNLSKITPYVNSALTYMSPDIHGLRFTVMLPLRDPADGSGNGIAGHYETVNYRNGIFAASYAHQSVHGVNALAANLAGASVHVGRSHVYLSYFNYVGGTSPYKGRGVSASTRYDLSHQWWVGGGWAYLQDLSGRNGNASQYSVITDYAASPQLSFYCSLAWLSNRANGTSTLRGVNVTGLPVAYPGASVRGIQLGMLKTF